MKNLNWKLGKQFGNLILQMSQEYVLSENPNKALEIYMDAFIGMTKEQALSLIKGENHLIVNEDKSEVIFVEGPYEKSAYYDWKRIIQQRLDDLYNRFVEIGKQANILINGNSDLIFNFQEFLGTSSFSLAIDLINLFEENEDKVDDYSLGNIEELAYQDLEIGENISYSEQIIGLLYRYWLSVKNSFIEFKKFELTYHWLLLYKFFESRNEFSFYSDKMGLIYYRLDQFANDFSFTLTNMKTASIPIQDEIRNYLSSDLNEWRKNGMLESNILDGYDAGWLSPEGIFYGARGETSALLHLQIADSLKFIGNGQPENFMESHSWIKIHHDSVYGYYRWKKDDNDETRLYCPTSAQLIKIKSYIDKFYGGNVNLSPLGTNIRKINDLLQMDEIQLHKVFSDH